MTNENNYPNGYKDGWSSADHATDNYSPYAAERKQRDALERSEASESEMARYEAGLENERRAREKNEEQRAKEEYFFAKIESVANEQYKQRKEAINIIVQQKRDEYNKKSWFGKAIASLRGKSFDKMKIQITEDAEKRIDRMQPEQIEQFIEKAGRKR